MRGEAAAVVPRPAVDAPALKAIGARRPTHAHAAVRATPALWRSPRDTRRPPDTRPDALPGPEPRMSA